MLDFFNQIPRSVKLTVAFLILIAIGTKFFGVDFLYKSGIWSSPQTDKTASTEVTVKDVEEVTIRVAIRNVKTKASIPDVTVEFDRRGVPVPVGYTDSAGYIDVKIPKTEYVKVYLSKPGFESVNYQLDPNIQDKNATYYLKEVTSPAVDAKPTSSVSGEKVISSPLPQQDRLNTTTPNTTNVSSLQVKGFQFDLQNCNQEVEKLVCRLKITSLEKDSPLRMHGYYNAQYQTRSIDASGNELIANMSQIGNSASNRFADSNFVQNVPMNGSISFKKLSSEVSKLKVIEVSFYNKETNNAFKIRFNNIDVIK